MRALLVAGSLAAFSLLGTGLAQAAVPSAPASESRLTLPAELEFLHDFLVPTVNTIVVDVPPTTISLLGALATTGSSTAYSGTSSPAN